MNLANNSKGLGKVRFTLHLLNIEDSNFKRFNSLNVQSSKRIILAFII